MARSIDEILNQILEAKNADANLASLNSTSKVSLYRLYAYCFAVATHYHERTWELFKVGLEKIAEESNVGTAKWLARKVLEYQHGETLAVINDTVKYNTVDTTKQIITRCAIKENADSRDIYIKVAKDDGVGGLTKLVDTEINGLKSYLNQIKMAGTKIIITTLEADKIAVHADIYYNAAYVPADVKANVINAINPYFKSIDFSGNIYSSKITDAIQGVEGVMDVVLSDVKCRMSIEDVSAAVSAGRVYESYAGYVLPESTAGYTLEDTIIMKPFEK